LRCILVSGFQDPAIFSKFSAKKIIEISINVS
jgi:hypothetical protein